MERGAPVVMALAGAAAPWEELPLLRQRWVRAARSALRLEPLRPEPAPAPQRQGSRQQARRRDDDGGHCLHQPRQLRASARELEEPPAFRDDGG